MHVFHTPIARSFKIKIAKCTRAVDINLSNISRIETGKQFVSPKTLEKLTKALGVSYASLFDFKKLEKQGEMMELLGYIQELDEQGVRIFNSSIKAYIKEKSK